MGKRGEIGRYGVFIAANVTYFDVFASSNA